MTPMAYHTNAVDLTNRHICRSACVRYVALHNLFILQSKVTPNILIDLLCGITSVPTVSVMCWKGSGFVLNIVNSVLSWLILRELFLIHSHTSVIQSSSCFIACLIESSSLLHTMYIWLSSA